MQLKTDETRLSCVKRSSPIWAQLILFAFLMLFVTRRAESETTILKPADVGILRGGVFSHGDPGVGREGFSGSLDQGVIEFQLPIFPTAVVISSVTLILDPYLAIESGSETSQITWRIDGYPGDGHADSSDLASGVPLTGPMVIDPNKLDLGKDQLFDVTAFVTGLIDSNQAFAGFVARTMLVSGPSNEGFEYFFARDSGPLSAHAPELRIDYQTVPEPNAVVLLLLSIGCFFMLRNLDRWRNKGRA